MTETPELLPCPFCGGTDLIAFQNAVSCRNEDCHATGPDMGHGQYAELANAAWNKRAPKPPKARVKTRKTGRYAVTGHFTSVKQAEDNPDTHVVETIRTTE